MVVQCHMFDTLIVPTQHALYASPRTCSQDVDHRAAMLHSHLRQAQAESRAAKQRLAQSEVEKIAILCDSEEAAWAVLADHDRRTTGNGQGRSPTIVAAGATADARSQG